MDAIYSLLRNNKTCGPFSLDQLSGMALSSADLIWVEGLSVKWNKPNEVEGLGEIFLASLGIESKNSTENKIVKDVELVVKYSRSLEDIKSEYYLWKEKQQIKRSALNFHYQTIPFILILLVFLSLLFIKGTDKNDIPQNHPTASVQVKNELSPLGSIR